jgi:glycosyltransferase involved in cell wall biosynthesis
MRILQINNAEELGGGSERVFQLTTKMLLDRGHDVATLSCGSKAFDPRKKSVLLARNKYYSKNPLAALSNIRNFVYRPATARATYDLVTDFQPDIAHLHIFYGQLSSSVLATLVDLNVPCVMTVHEYRMLCPISTLYTPEKGVCEQCATGSKLHAIVGRCNRNSLAASGISAIEAIVRDKFFPYQKLINHFFMVSHFCLQKHAQYIPEIKSKSSILYNFVRDIDRNSQPQYCSQQAPFLYCGRLSHEKGVAFMCEAFAKRPHLDLRIAGDGPLTEELKTRFASNSNIKFLGKLDPIELKMELSAARFSITPSEWYENNPMAILESFALGTPVIGSDIGGIPELVTQNKTGFLFSPSDLNSFLSTLDQANSTSIEKRHKMGEMAIELIRDRHSESGYYEQLLRGYQNALAGNSEERN